ncbi:hypothetical protein G6F22_020441 [Rhizopus arrhizus]|nr:hypothetical protein G6F22_020441 [Rhizopus arrhizus]
MDQVAPQVVRIAAEAVGARHVARAVLEAVVIGHMRGVEHEGWVPLQQRDPEIGRAVGPAPAPHPDVRVVVMDDADAQRQEQHQRIQRPPESVDPLPGRQRGQRGQISQALPVASVAQRRQPALWTTPVRQAILDAGTRPAAGPPPRL